MMIRPYPPLRVGLLAIAVSMVLTGTALAAGGEPPTRGLYLQLIRQARADGRPRAAIAYLDDFDRQFPNDLDARLLRINSLLDLGQNDKAEAAIATLGRTLPTGPQFAAVSAVRGHVLAARGAWAEAVPRYEAAVAADPTDPLLRNALGYALIRTGAFAGAIEALRGASDLAPGDAVVRNNLILALMLGGQKGAFADALVRVGDRRAQADLRRQIADEADRVATLTPAAAPAMIADATHTKTSKKDR
jgi:Flp pilus assembly protein TadD